MRPRRDCGKAHAIRATDPYLVVFAFHEVNDQGSLLISPNTAIGVKTFERFVGALVESHEVVSLFEALVKLCSGSLRRRTTVLTFDDAIVRLPCMPRLCFEA
ncbi:MAG: hypothetical protein WA970_19235 [Gammaproteobacteria bacterium]